MGVSNTPAVLRAPHRLGNLRTRFVPLSEFSESRGDFSFGITQNSASVSNEKSASERKRGRGRAAGAPERQRETARERDVEERERERAP